MGLDEASCSELRLAGALHDLGKVGVAREILCKPGPLDPDEFAEMARHPMIAWKILEPAKFLASVREIILVHHERYDGSGYPNQLKGDQSSLAGSIISLADAYDSMTSDRPYRRRLSHEQALGIIKKGKGRQFDPKVTEAFLAAHAAMGEPPAAVVRSREAC
jgi:HD-GYP domain-containing protein (c-di-GMP phosphodiesterase class II)